MSERRTESCRCSGASCLRKLAILIFRQSETNLLIKSEVWSRAARYFSSVLRVRGKGRLEMVMENENAWTARKGKEKKRRRERGKESKKDEKRKKGGRGDERREGGKCRIRVGKREEESAAKETRTRGRSRSCVAQRETFNSVTPGLNYHAETIVPGKIKKGAPRALLSFVGPRTIVLRRGARKLEYGEENRGMGGGREGQRRNPFFVCRTGCCARFNSAATHGARERGKEDRGDKK